MPPRLDGLPLSEALSGQRVLAQYVEAQNSWMMRLLCDETKNCEDIGTVAVDFAKRISKLALILEEHAATGEWRKGQQVAAQILQLGRLAELRMLIAYERRDSALKFALECVNNTPDPS